MHASKSVLIKSSEFFKSETASTTGTEQRPPIDLPSESPEVFMGYLQWLYTREINAKAEDNNSHSHLARF
jgi:hypothetical protein